MASEQDRMSVPFSLPGVRLGQAHCIQNWWTKVLHVGVLQYRSPCILNLGIWTCPSRRWCQVAAGGQWGGCPSRATSLEVPPKALCSCKADYNSLESFFYPLLNSLSLSDNLF